jgi:hypothetical protein
LPRFPIKILGDVFTGSSARVMQLDLNARHLEYS